MGSEAHIAMLCSELHCLPSMLKREDAREILAVSAYLDGQNTKLKEKSEKK